MKALPSIIASAAMVLSTAVCAQTTPPPSGNAGKATPPAASPPAPTSPSNAPTTPQSTTGTQPDYKMTDQEAGAWVNKTVYSSDNKNMGEVAAIQRDTAGKVTELHADIGGFLGIGESRVRLMPGQFKFNGDNIVLNMTAEQARQLPKIGK